MSSEMGHCLVGVFNDMTYGMGRCLCLAVSSGSKISNIDFFKNISNVSNCSSTPGYQVDAVVALTEDATLAVPC
ncbi:hypothetical protein J6590_095561, partial [Homalodisca vitripennis]